MRLTADDPNFNNWLKQKIEYTMDRGERSKKNVMSELVSKQGAGYSAPLKPPVQHDALAAVFAERTLTSEQEERKRNVMNMLASINFEEKQAAERKAQNAKN